MHHDGHELIAYQPVERRESRPPAAATEPAPPEAIDSLERLYLTGLHL